MKIIFLDIDGVLNPLHYENALYKMWKATDGEIKSKDKYGSLFFDQNVQALSHILYMTNAKIVISSTWRMNGIESLYEMWDERKIPGEIIGVTPILRTPEFHIRGHEIKQWIMQNILLDANSTKEFDEYVIIDDNNDMLASQQKNFVQTNSHVGLTMKDAKKAIEILLKQQL